MNKNQGTGQSILTAIALTLTLAGCSAKPNLGDMSRLNFQPTRIAAEARTTMARNAEELFQTFASHRVTGETFSQESLFGQVGRTYWYAFTQNQEELGYSALLVGHPHLLGRYNLEIERAELHSSGVTSHLMFTALDAKGAALLSEIEESELKSLLSQILKTERKQWQVHDPLIYQALVGTLDFTFSEQDGDQTLWENKTILVSLTDRGKNLMERDALAYYSPKETVQLAPETLIQWAGYAQRSGHVFNVPLNRRMGLVLSAIWGSLTD